MQPCPWPVEALGFIFLHFVGVCLLIVVFVFYFCFLPVVCYFEAGEGQTVSSKYGLIGGQARAGGAIRRVRKHLASNAVKKSFRFFPGLKI